MYCSLPGVMTEAVEVSLKKGYCTKVCQIIISYVISEVSFLNNVFKAFTVAKAFDLRHQKRF